MKPILDTQTVTNLTELWWNGAKQDILFINGFSGNGSDYEIFRDFCTCIERMPYSSMAQVSQKQLFDLFGCELKLGVEHCAEIWKLTAQYLMDTPTTRESAYSILIQGEKAHASAPQGVSPRPCVANTLFSVTELSDLGCTDWRAWSENAEKALERRLQNGVLPCLSLPKAFQPQKNDLYHVNRVLSGEDQNADLWLTQLAAFLFGFCAARKLRPLIRSACPMSCLIDLLNMTASRTPLPNLVWMPESSLQCVFFAELCKTVMYYRSGETEGIPPVLCAVEAKGASVMIPTHLLVSVSG